MKQETLHDLFGEQGDHLWRLARGIYDRDVVPDRKAKSISHETTFAVDIDDREILEAWLLELADQLGSRLRRSRKSGKVLHLKVRFSNFQTLTRSLTLDNPTNVTQEIIDASMELLRNRVDRRLPIRLLGVGMSRFDNSSMRQQSLFDEPEHDQQSELDRMSDQIRNKFGHDALSRASRLLHGTRHRPQPGAKDE